MARVIYREFCSPQLCHGNTNRSCQLCIALDTTIFLLLFECFNVQANSDFTHADITTFCFVLATQIYN